MKNKKRLTIIATIVIIIGVIGSAFTFRLNAAEPISEEKVISNNQVTSVQVDTDNARVQILPTAASDITVVLDGESRSSDNLTFDTNVEDSTLFITVKEKHLKWFNFNFLELLDGLSVMVYLPEKAYRSLIVSSDNGYISAEQLLAESLDFRTSNGRIEMRDIQTKTASAHSDNGRIELNNILAESTFMETDNGKIILDHVEGDLEGETNNGSISLITEDLDRNINLETDNGRITVETAKEPTNVEFDVEVDNGRVDILGTYNGNAVIGDGKYLIKLASDNGSITVEN